MPQDVVFTVDDLYRIIGRKEVTILRLDALVTQLNEQNAVLLARLNGRSSPTGSGPALGGGPGVPESAPAMA